MSVRRIVPADVEPVVAMVHDLAAYERAAERCRLTTESLHRALFGPAPALFGHVATVAPDDRPAGFALWFLNYSTWDGAHGIYLEDLYVRPEHRGGGHGRSLLAALAAECVRSGYTRLQWWVLDWNAPAIGFYRALGAEAMSEWEVFRLSGEPLRALGATDLTAHGGPAVAGQSGSVP